MADKSLGHINKRGDMNIINLKRFKLSGSFRRAKLVKKKFSYMIINLKPMTMSLKLSTFRIIRICEFEFMVEVGNMRLNLKIKRSSL